MSNKILIKTGSGAPSNGVLAPSELGFDKDNKKLYIGLDGGSSMKIGGGSDNEINPLIVTVNENNYASHSPYDIYNHINNKGMAQLHYNGYIYILTEASEDGGDVTFFGMGGDDGQIGYITISDRKYCEFFPLEKNDVVLFTPQTLTEQQKAQARANIGAGTGNGASITVEAELNSNSTNPVQNKVITSALNNKIDISGGLITGPLSFSGGDAASAGKIVLSSANASQITDSSINTIFGFTSTNASALTVGSTSYSLNLRGSSSRPTYNSNSLALYSDLGTISGKIIQGAPSNDSTIIGMNRFQSDLFVQGDGNAPNIPKVAGFYLGKSQSDENRHMDIVSGSNYSYIDFNKAGSNEDYDVRLIANVDSGLTELRWGIKSSKILNVAGVIQQGGIAVALSTDITNIQDSLAQKQPLGNYAIQDGSNTFSGNNTFSKSNTFDGEQKFSNSSYCPTINDTAPNVGCAFKASRGLFNEALIDKIIMTAHTGGIPFYTYSGANSGAFIGLTEVARITPDAFILKPASGEGGQIQLEAAQNDTTNNGICIDTAWGKLRIFGLPSADEVSKKGTGQVIEIDPYGKTINGKECTFTGSAFKSDSTAAAIKICESNEVNFGSNINIIYFGYENRLNSSGVVNTYRFGTHTGSGGMTSGTIECGSVVENGTALASKYAPKYSYGDTPLVPGTSALASGTLYFVYE